MKLLTRYAMRFACWWKGEHSWIHFRWDEDGVGGMKSIEGCAWCSKEKWA